MSLIRPKTSTLVLIAILLGCASGSTFAASKYFQEVTPDANGDYLWSEVTNWDTGIPSISYTARLGSSSKVEALLQSPGAACGDLKIADGTGAVGSSLTIVTGGELTTSSSIVIGKDATGHLTMTGGSMNIGNYLSIGSNASTDHSSMTMTDGNIYVDDWVLIGRSTSAPTSSGSSMTVTGGAIISDHGIRVDSDDPNDPGLLTISGAATWNNQRYGFDVLAGIFEINGGNASILTDGVLLDAGATLKLSGTGISMIVAANVTFNSGAVLDVSDLNIPYGTYTVINATNTTDNGLAFAAGTNTAAWSFQVDPASKDLKLTYADSSLLQLTVNNGTGDGYYDANTVVAISADVLPGGTFDVWTGDTANIANVNAPNTTITMPATPTTITATYLDDPNTFMLTVTAGSGDGVYDPNTVVDISAALPPTAQIFDAWTGDTANIANVNEANTTIIMPAADTAITATYADDPSEIDPTPTHSPFQEVTADANGDYRWSEPNNWENGFPGRWSEAEIGGDSAGQAVHCTLYVDAICRGVQIAEHANTEGSSLLIGAGATLTSWHKAQVGKDRLGYLTINGTLNIVDNQDFVAGGPWGVPPALPSRGIVVINSTGVLISDHIGINKGPRSPEYPADNNATGSTITVNGGTMSCDNGITISTNDPNYPGILTTTGSAVVSCTGNIVNIWAGTWVIDGGAANISVVDMICDGDKHFTNGRAVFKLSGDGVSTIVANNVTLDSATLIDVSEANFAEGTYTLIDANNITDGGITFAAGANPNEWSLNVDANNDLTVTYTPGLSTFALTVNGGTGDGYYEANTVVDLSANTVSAGDIFDVWTGDTTGIANVNDPNTTITMPASAATVTATYKDDPNTLLLTVNNGTGDGYYDPNTIVNLSADAPPIGKLFDTWTGDTANIANVHEANTTIRMPSADAAVTATYVDDPNYLDPGRGYHAIPCGFDMNRDGIIGEDGVDNLVGNGITTDPDGDGIDEDLIYVDATIGNDTTGDGSPGNPYKTIQHALNQADGPGDGAEDIIAISGVFAEDCVLTQSGLAGYYTRDNFQFPDNPMMIIGWDKDADGEYPPYDTDDTAVMDGNFGYQGQLAFLNQGVSYFEIAHLEAREYNYVTTQNYTRGFLRIYDGQGVASHIYAHDIEMTNMIYINRGTSGSQSIIYNFWTGGTVSHVAIINNLVDGFAQFFIRGAPSNNGGNYRFQNLTLLGRADPNGLLINLTPFKIWGEHNNVEYLDNYVDSRELTHGPYDVGLTCFNVRPCVRNITIRNNEIVSFYNGVGFEPFSDGYCESRSQKDILVDRNIIRNTNDYYSPTPRVNGIFLGDGGTLLAQTSEDVTITNNFIWISDTDMKGRGIRIDSGAMAAVGQPPVGTITLAGNTIYGPGSGSDFRGIGIWSTTTYPQDSYVIKNNLIANIGASNVNFYVAYEANDWTCNGNIYDDDGSFVWNGDFYLSFAQWKNYGNDPNGSTGDPLFVDAANGNFHLDPNDTVAIGVGLDISSITDHDFDGDTRDATTLTVGADVQPGPVDTEPPTIVAWHSAADHARSVGEALLEITDDGSFSEPRSAGISKLVVNFSEVIDPTSFTSASVEIAGLDANGTAVDLGGVTIGVSLQSGDTEGVVTFTPALPDYARYVVRVSGITDVAGNPLSGDNDRIMTTLRGDASGGLRVNATDFSSVRAARTQLISSSNSAQIRCDVSCDGQVNVADLSLIRAQRGNDATGISDPVIAP